MQAHERKFVSIILLAATLILAGVSMYSFVTAWGAPQCASWKDLESWCLPIGFVGPFADYWANRSFWNARVLATTEWLFTSAVLGVAIYFLFLRPTPQSNKIVVIVFLGIVTTLILGNLALNTYG